MRDRDVGDVLVTDGDQPYGVLTDRDIVVRVVAETLSPEGTPVETACSASLAVVAPEDSVDRAVSLMRQHAVRRLPVLDEGEPVGIVSIGDLAVELDPDSAVADITEAPSNI